MKRVLALMHALFLATESSEGCRGVCRCVSMASGAVRLDVRGPMVISSIGCRYGKQTKLDLVVLVLGVLASRLVDGEPT